jgi:small-conductance mechanosensitive channel
MTEALTLQGLLDSADTVLFRIGGSPVTLGVLLRTVLSIAALFWIASWLRRWLATRALTRFQHLDMGTREALASALRYAVLGLGLALILQNAGIRLTALGVVAGALGVGVGFGLQNIISNFISGLIIMFERPIKIGDMVELGGVSGTVQDIGARRTTIVTADHQAVLVPNQRFITENVTNFAYLGGPVRLRLPVTLPAGAELEMLRAPLLSAAAAQSGVVAEPAPALMITSLAAEAPTLELAVWHKPHDISRPDLQSALNTALLQVLRQFKPAPPAGLEKPKVDP